MWSSFFKYASGSILRDSFSRSSSAMNIQRTIVTKNNGLNSILTFTTTGSGLLNSGLQGVQTLHPTWNPLGMLSQRRFKSRGNTYQPSTLKRKRKFGFFARAKDKLKSKILKNRRDKGRWYLTH
ncbi:similar to Saccharomyces cerevisiae YDR115W Putative mitochondrial ribosomal protein of the large subunit, has similarity to E. coli L34 ribosomal protein [Maudiozyma barnettii]|uniref:Large ribosomal subunit protein bL34m n=1 Tax=Maudiozyma barnettii TaxID=61262 RepID=A0A8H2VHT2_9SACH|nr:putative mitochondrial 54S ribosomal protein [Kazachstania barnettii]CAB4255706.1 similar to Saccharomyces cerevisiae YDR115W Putative mitochondrial ribosomal protein of the large subunit, has similarity to E. coli L34 ribosomal protein [Kazachstania barnettii]CAD1784267.1 similar to Saccharomyces cerevisiae YDR115W Putative mitochondrial ribosomal protein of the large subunit, has similarity to E. coli L34 ribosomal protein [Kazachstania barnettii]